MRWLALKISRGVILFLNRLGAKAAQLNFFAAHRLNNALAPKINVVHQVDDSAVRELVRMRI